jgi:hypothetical protein
MLLLLIYKIVNFIDELLKIIFYSEDSNLNYFLQQ